MGAEGVKTLLVAYEIWGKSAPTSAKPDVRRKHAHFRRLLQPHWLPKLQTLRTTMHELQKKTPPDVEVIVNIQKMIKEWEKLGTVYRFSRRSTEDDSVAYLTNYISTKDKLKGCHMRECPCYGQKSPWHSSRRVCKGCWVAFYCGEQCQKRWAIQYTRLARLSYSSFVTQRLGTTTQENLRRQKVVPDIRKK